MWADSFLRAEEQHVLLLLLWGALTVVSSTAIAITLVAQHRASAMLSQFARQLAVWGLLAAIVAAVEWHGIHLRDLASATRVERLVWFRMGFDVGIVGMGIILAATRRLIARSPGALGAGVAIMVHGLALFAVDVQFASSISR